MGHALRERATVQSSASAVDDMISQVRVLKVDSFSHSTASERTYPLSPLTPSNLSQAQLVSSNLLDQRKVFDSIGDKASQQYYHDFSIHEQKC